MKGRRVSVTAARRRRSRGNKGWEKSEVGCGFNATTTTTPPSWLYHHHGDFTNLCCHLLNTWIKIQPNGYHKESYSYLTFQKPKSIFMFINLPSTHSVLGNKRVWGEREWIGIERDRLGKKLKFFFLVFFLSWMLWRWWRRQEKIMKKLRKEDEERKN